MLAAFGIVGFTDIHQMNGLKNFLAVCIEGWQRRTSSGTAWCRGRTRS